MEVSTNTSTQHGGWLRPFRWYLSPRTGEQSVIGWWEKRRSLYNLFLFLWGVFAIAVLDRSELHWRPDNVLEPAVLGTILLVLLVTANFWYTGGWVVELLVQLCMRRPVRSFGPRALLVGTLFSLVFVTYIFLL